MSGCNLVARNARRLGASGVRGVMAGLLGLALLAGLNCPPLGQDTDGDGVADNLDNCPALANADQADGDGDGVGDVCDNCVDTANTSQADADGDDAGDACDECDADANKTEAGQCGCGTADTDTDGDGVADCNDNCDNDVNPGQNDQDGNGVGDACEPDPTADAGADASVDVGESVSLMGTGTGHPPLSFSWAQTSGPTQTLTSNTSATASVAGANAGTAVFTLTVTDGLGNSATDTVTVTVNPGVQNLTATINIDNITGTDGDETLSGPLDVVNGGTAPNTVQTGDIFDLGAGDDSATIFFQNGTGGAQTVTPTFMNTETLNISDFAAANGTTLSLLNSTGITAINSVNSTFNVVVTNIAALASLGLSGTSTNLTTTFVTAATTGDADAGSVTLSQVGSDDQTAGNDPTITINTGANGLESLAIASTTGPNFVNAIAHGANTLVAMTITGDQSLAIQGAIPGTVNGVDASGQTAGGVTLALNNLVNTFTGGAGNDNVSVAGDTFVTTGANTDTLAGGDGTDTIGVTTAQAGAITVAATALTNLTGFEDAEVTNALANAFDTTLLGLSSNIYLPAGFGGAVTLTVANGDVVKLGSSVFNSAAADSGANGTIDIPGIGTTDSVTVELNDHDSGNALIVTGSETVNLVSNVNDTGAAADAGVNVIAGATTLTPTFGTGLLNITGTEALTLTGAVTAGTLDASTFGHILTMGAISALGSQITGGTANDQLRGSNNNDIIGGGAGNDLIRGEAGADILTLGDGADIVDIADFGATGADRKTVTDFDDTVGADTLNFDSDDITLAGTDNFATAASLQTHSVAGAVTVLAATEVLVVTSGTQANFSDNPASLNGTNLLTAIGGVLTVNADGDDILVAVGNTAATEVGIYTCQEGGDGDANVAAADCTLTAVLQGANVAIGGLTFNNFTANDNLD